MTINWSVIESEGATDFHVGREYTTALRKGFLDDGHKYIFGGDDRGYAVGVAAGYYNTKLNKDLLKAIAIYIDDIHSEGEYMVSNGENFHLLHNIGIDVHITTCGRVMKRIGLNLSPIKKN